MTPRGTTSVILLDIEGTTSDKRFVTDTLFPYARRRLPGFLLANHWRPDLAPLIDLARAETGAVSLAAVAVALQAWIDQDQKREPLKSIQGLIWAEGYADKTLLSHVYDDVKPALRRWTDAGLRCAIYSSGSAEAQRQLFRHTNDGDLTPLLDGHFDLAVGGKRAADSYRQIVADLAVPAADIRFYSDIPAELAAAAEAGLEVVLVERDGPLADPGPFRRITSLAAEP